MDTKVIVHSTINLQVHTLLLLQTKLAEKDSKLIFWYSLLFSFRVEKWNSSIFYGGGGCAPPLHGLSGGTAPLHPPVYALEETRRGAGNSSERWDRLHQLHLLIYTILYDAL